MADGYLMSEAFRRQVVSVVQQVLRKAGVEYDQKTQTRRPRVSRHVGYLDGNLTASSDPTAAWDSQPSATFSVWLVASDGSLTDSGDNLTVYHRRDIQLDSGIFCEIEYKQGVWQPIDANCTV